MRAAHDIEPIPLIPDITATAIGIGINIIGCLVILTAETVNLHAYFSHVKPDTPK